MKLTYNLKQDWLFYLVVLAYGLLVTRMTVALWLGDGINIFASYSSATDLNSFILDANKIYWSKTSFLFLTLLLFAFNFDYRLVLGSGMLFWGVSLSLIFGIKIMLIAAGTAGLALIIQQVLRKQVFRS